jgi:hypothetical protein
MSEIRREDYRSPDWLVPQIELSFDLDPEQTRVSARLTVERNGSHDRPLRLDGDDIEPLSVKVDGAEADWRMDGPALVVPVSGDRAIVETEVEISPAANTKLMGLYASGGILCTQCEAEGFPADHLLSPTGPTCSANTGCGWKPNGLDFRCFSRTAIQSLQAIAGTAATGPSGRTRSPSRPICSRSSAAT